MKNKIFMYLFIFSVLLLIFQFVNSKNIFESYETKFTKFEQREQSYKDSIISLQNENSDLKLFNLEFNDDALSYFDDKGYNSLELIPFIKDELYKLNNYKVQEVLLNLKSRKHHEKVVDSLDLYLSYLKIEVFSLPNLQVLLDQHFHVSNKN